MSSVKNYSAVESELMTKADKQLNIHNLITDLAVHKFVSAQNYLEMNFFCHGRRFIIGSLKFSD